MLELVHLGVRRELVAKVVGEGLHVLLPDGVSRSWPCPIATSQVVLVHHFRVKVVTTARKYHSRTLRMALLTPTVGGMLPMIIGHHNLLALGSGQHDHVVVQLALLQSAKKSTYFFSHFVGEQAVLQRGRAGQTPRREGCDAR